MMSTLISIVCIAFFFLLEYLRHDAYAAALYYLSSAVSVYFVYPLPLESPENL